MVCPTGTNTTVHAGFRACPCLDGYYRLDRFGPCFACNATSQGLACQNDFPRVMSGYWWSWKQSSNQEKFVKFVREIRIENDSYSNESVGFKGDLPIVYRCPLAKSCNGGVTDEEMCRKGYSGPLCSLCDNGYFFWSSECVTCPPVWRSCLQLASIVLLFVLFLFLLFKVDKLTIRGKRQAATVVDQIASKVKIIVGFVQVMAGVLSALRYVPWPKILITACAWLKSIEMNVIEIATPSCLSSRLRLNALQKTVVNLTGQCLLLLLVFAYYWIRYCAVPHCCPRLRSEDRSRSLARRSCMRNSWWIMFLCYPSATAQIMATLPYKMWTCHQICHYRGQQDCPWYLKVDMSIQCDYSSQGDHRVLFLICWSMSVYVLLLPLLLLFGLYKRHKIPSDTPDDDNEFIPLRNRRNSARDDILSSLQFLDENYEAKFWFWELLEIARKFLLTCGIEYFGGKSLSGVAIAAMIANIFLVLHAHFKPIKRKSEQLLQLLSLMVISLSLMLGTLIALQDATSNILAVEDSYDRNVFSIVVMLVNGLFVIFLIGKCSILINLLFEQFLSLSGRLVFCGYKATKTVRENEGSCKLLPWLIYFIIDEEANTEARVSTQSFDQHGNGMSAFADDESEDS